MKALGYVRVSTDEQVQRGWGLDAQRDRIREAAAARDWEVLEVIADEGKSGTNIERPGLERILDLLAADKADVLVVAKLDRLSRSLRDFAGLMAVAREQGWEFVALDLGVDTSTPAGRMMANIVATFAEYERDVLATRVREALAAARSSGVVLGRPSNVPLAVRRRIIREKADGASYGEIARGLDADGVPTAQGGRRWWPSTVKMIIERES